MNEAFCSAAESAAAASRDNDALIRIIRTMFTSFEVNTDVVSSLARLKRFCIVSLPRYYVYTRRKTEDLFLFEQMHCNLERDFFRPPCEFVTSQ